MIWIAIALAGLVLLGIAVLLAPLYFEAAKDGPETPACYSVRIAAVHPSLAEVSITMPEGRTILRVFGRRAFPRQRREETPEGEVPAGGATAQDADDAALGERSELPTPEPDLEAGAPETVAKESEEPAGQEEIAEPSDTEEDRDVPLYHRVPHGGEQGHGYDVETREQEGGEKGDDGDDGERRDEGDTATRVTGEETTSRRSLWQRIRKHPTTFFLSQKGWIGKLLRWAVRVLQSLFVLIAFDRCRLAVKGGTGDHAVTGMITGAYWGLLGTLKSTGVGRVSIAFEPVFGQAPAFEWHGAVRLRTTIGRLLWPAAVALGSFPYLSSALVWRRFRRWRREEGAD